jgi:hypothetical protein
VLDKESIGSAVMVAPTPAPWLPLALTQDTPQPHPHPGVQRSEGAFVTMFEIFKLASQRAIDVGDDRLQALALGTSRLGPNRVLKLPETLLPRPFHPPISQKVKAPLLGGIHNPCFHRMQLEARLLGPLPHLLQDRFGFPLAPAQDDEVVGIPHHLDPLLRHLVIQGIEMEIRQQRTNHRPLRGPSLFLMPLDRPVYQGAIYDSLTTANVLAEQVDRATGLTATSDATIRDSFPGNIIPANRFDRVTKNFIPLFPGLTFPSQASNPLETGLRWDRRYAHCLNT